MSMDITNTFAQTEVLQVYERTMKKIRGELADMLLEIDPKNMKTPQSEKAATIFFTRAC